MENERPIEKLLRRYAKKRDAEAGVPPELHPATRRLLQGEVTRQFGKADRPGTEKRWFPRLALKFGMLAFLGLCAIIFLSSLFDTKLTSQGQLAMRGLNKSESGSNTRGTDSDRNPTLAANEPQPAAAPPPPAPPLPATPAAEMAMSKSAPAAALSYASGTGQPPARLEAFVATNSFMSLAEAAPGQRFTTFTAQLEDADGKKLHANNVLSNFRIEQDGNKLRVVDADGSTYEGVIEVARDKQALTARRTRSAEENESLAPVPQYSFQVSGTNVSLQQQVIFSGYLTPLTNSTATIRSPGLLNATITGKVQVNGGREIQIRATPASK